MDFSNIEGFEEFFIDGVLDPSLASPAFRDGAAKYEEVAPRIFLLFEPANGEPADFDIVFVHGIGSDEFKCWTNEKGVMWPATFLPQDFPSARILTVGYAHALWNWAKDEEGSKEGVVAAEEDAQSVNLEVAENAPKQVAGSPKTRKGKEKSGKSAHVDSGGAWLQFPELEATWKSFWQTEESGKDNHNTRGSASQLAGSGAAGHGDGSSRTSHGSDPNELPLSPPTPAGQDASSGAGESSRSRSTLYDLLMPELGAGTEMKIGETVESAHPHGTAETREKHGSRQLHSFRLVAADMAERLIKAGVGVGERPVVFVVHSMGGLITKQMLVSFSELISLVPRRSYLGTLSASDAANADDKVSYAAAMAQADVFLHSIRGVVFYGTPHFGSGLASVITGMQRYYSSLGGLTPTNVVTGLGDHNRDALVLLNDRFLEVVDRLNEHGAEADVTALGSGAAALTTPVSLLLASRPPGVSLISFGETKKLNGLVQVVEPESANPAPDNPRYPFYLIDGDHCRINRPVAKTYPGYAMLYGFLDRLQQRGELSSPLRGNALLLPGPSELPDKSVRETEKPVNDTVKEATDEFDRQMRTFEEKAWDRLERKLSEQLNGPSCVPDGMGSTATTSEALILARTLDHALKSLSLQLSQFFGRVIPPQLDGLFVLGDDMAEFLHRGAQQLRRLESGRRQAEPTRGGSLAPLSERFVQSFTVPTRLLLHWAEHAADMVRGFEQQQRERAASQASPDTLWASGNVEGIGGMDSHRASVGAHLSSVAVRSLKQLEDEIGILQGEWEGFRRCLSVAIRHEQWQPQLGGSAVGTLPLDSMPSLLAISDERVAIVFFAKTVRAIAAEALRDEECLSRMIATFVDTSLELALSATQGRGDAVALTSVEPKANNVALGGGVSCVAPSNDMASDLLSLSQADQFSSALGRDIFASVIADTLAASRDRGGGVGAVDRGGPSVASALVGPSPQNGAERLHEAVPALQATASFLLACYHLFLDCHSADRPTAARASLKSTIESLETWRRRLARLEKSDSYGLDVRTTRQASKKDARTSSASSSPSSFWRAGKDSDTRGEAEVASAGNGGGDAWYNVRLLTESFSLLAHSLLCLTHVRELEARPMAIGAGEQPKAALEELVANLARSTVQARGAYERAERALDGRREEGAEQPFLPGRTDADSIPHPSGSGDSRTTSEEDSFLETKKVLRSAITDAINELEELMNTTATESKGGGVKQAHRRASGSSSREAKEASPGWYAAGSNWFSRQASSVPKLLINSVLNAWDAVRRGGEVRETPRYFASNAFVFWWTVETYALRTAEHSGARWSAGDGAGGVAALRGLQPKGPCVYSAILPPRRTPDHEPSTREEATRTGTASAITTVTAGPTDATVVAARQVGETAARRRQQRVFHAAHAKVQAQWVTATGFVEAAGSHQTRIKSMQTFLQTLLTTAEAEEAEAMGKCIGELLVAKIPDALGDAARLDSMNPTSRCLLGHWHFLNLRSSPDAAHAYAQAIAEKFSPRSELFQAAAVGLGWVHLHRVRATTTSRWMEDSRGNGRWQALAGEVGLPKHGGAAYARPCTHAMHSEFGHVLDQLTLRTAPGGFTDFCGDACELLRFSSNLSRQGPRATAASQYNLIGRGEEWPPRSSSAAQGAATLTAQRLGLAQMYFRTVLDVAPTDIGALCGMGRLHSLLAGGGVTIAGGESPAGGALAGLPYSAAPASPLPIAAVADGAGGAGRVVNLQDAAVYFEAAVRIAETLDEAQPAPRTAGNVLDPVFSSYAAYWMGSSAAAGVCSASGDNAAAAVARSRHWYKRAVMWDPLNDWALTSLGLDCAHRARHGSGTGVDGARGLCLLDLAQKVNPTNQWALWGLARYGDDPVRRKECFRQLRALLAQRYWMRR